MDANKVLEVLLDMAPQLLPILDSGNPDFTVIMADGGFIDTPDTEDRAWDMRDVSRDFRRNDIKTEEQLRKVVAEYIPFAALNEIQRGYDPALPPAIGNYFYSLMYAASWKLHAMNVSERRAYADVLVAYLARVAPPKFATVPQKYFDAFKLGL